MATEAALINKLSDEVEFSGKIAKKHHRSRNSSRFLKSKQKRLPDRTCSDSDDARIGTPLTRRHQRKQNDRSGYSSSEEQSERGSNLEEYGGTSDDVSENQIHPSVLRKRKNRPQEGMSKANSTESKTLIDAQHVPSNRSPKGWELIGEGKKYSDLSVNGSNESSDDFWKPNSQRKSTQKEQKVSTEQPSKVEATKNEPAPVVPIGRFRRFLRWRPRLLVMAKNCRSEWTLFKTDYHKDWLLLKRQYYECSIGLLVIFILCGIGGIIFHSTEGAFEMFYKCGVKRVKRDFLDLLYLKRWLSEDEWKSLARTKLMEFENQLYDAYEAGMSSYSGQKGWSFINSFIYSFTVVTTIGYGHLAPVTTAGRVITIVYSIFGIPLFLILLADYGKLLTRGIKFVWAYVRRVYYTGSCRKVRKAAPVQMGMKGMQLVIDNVNKVRKASNAKLEDEPVFPRPVSPTDTPALSTYTIDDNFNLPISVAFAVLLVYIIGGAFLFSSLEQWALFDAFYFVFISTSTIGLGDMVPTGQIWVLLCSLVYFIFGLALTTMCINVVTERLTDSFRAATAKIGASMGLELAEEAIEVDGNEQEDLPS